MTEQEIQQYENGFNWAVDVLKDLIFNPKTSSDYDNVR